MPRSLGSSDSMMEDSPFKTLLETNPDANEFLGFPNLSLTCEIPNKRYSIPAKLPRPKEFYRKELEEIANTLERKFKQSDPHELEYVHSEEAHNLFMSGLQLFQEILKYSVAINSDTFRSWVLIQRWSGRMQRPSVLYDQIKQLGIHRPSFRLCASILTSYANGSYQLKKREYIECAIDSLVRMKEHNYIPNTYVYNALFVMCNKNQLYREVWKFFIELLITCRSTALDGFSCASLMETCVAEQNPQKGKAIYEIFKNLPAQLKKNNEKYIAQLKSKLDDIYQEQAQSYNFAALYEWKSHSGTSSQQSPEKSELFFKPVNYDIDTHDNTLTFQKPLYRRDFDNSSQVTYPSRFAPLISNSVFHNSQYPWQH